MGAPRVLVAYASTTGLDKATAIEVANEIAEVPGVEVDVQPMPRVASIRPYVAVYLGWLPTGKAGRLQLARFFDANAALLAARRIWGVQRGLRAEGVFKAGSTRLTRLQFRRPVLRRRGEIEEDREETGD